MRVLGLTTMGSSAAALVENGIVVFAAEEERFSRRKNDGAFPLRSIDALLQHQDISLSDIDLVCVYWDRKKIGTRAKSVLWSLLCNPEASRSKLNRLKNVFLWSDEQELDQIQNQGSWASLFRVRSILTKKFGKFSAEIRFLNHHSCHVASAVEFAGFDESLVLSFDGGGEDLSTLLIHHKDGVSTEILSEKWPNSLGHFYSFFTGYLGFRMLEDEYKVMGLAPYGDPVYRDILFQHVLRNRPEGGYKFNTKIADYHEALAGRFSKEIEHLLGAPRKLSEPITDRHKNLAASIQSVFESIVQHLVEIGLRRKPEVKKLCVVGGCGLNVSSNGHLLRSTEVETIFVPPAPHDAGCAIGACAIGHHEIDGQSSPVKMKTPFLGQNFSNTEIHDIIVDRGFICPPENQENALFRMVANHLANGMVVAWFQGRSEFGPRALGNRSILGDPRNAAIQSLMNKKVKKRESFRPFAPSVKEESMSKYFDLSQPSPYMNIVAKVRPSFCDVIPAVTHVDQTARVHSVSRSYNPRFWGLLNEFEALTGVPILLNTSFNIQEPIVNTPEQALNTFLNSDIDLLVLNDYVLDSGFRKTHRHRSF